MGLKNKTCTPCTGGVLPLTEDQYSVLLQKLGSNWNINDEARLEKTYLFKDFISALEYTNQIGEIAEEEDHHPDIALTWGKVIITLYTHKIDGLTESDFILATKYDDTFKEFS